MGSDKAKVLVMVESEPNEKQVNPHKKKRAMGYVKMVVMDKVITNAVNFEVGKAVDESATIYADGNLAFRNVGEVVENFTQETIKAKDQSVKLPWVHTVIANAKRQFLGVHHSVGKEYLQNYLNEYCYKLNRRNFKRDSFDGMITAGVNETWN